MTLIKPPSGQIFTHANDVSALASPGRGHWGWWPAVRPGRGQGAPVGPCGCITNQDGGLLGRGPVQHVAPWVCPPRVPPVRILRLRDTAGRVG